MLARGEEAEQAKDSMKMIGNPANAREQLIISHAHGSLRMNRDRDFRGLFFFISNLWGEIAPNISLRVFDVGRGCLHREVTVHVFRDGSRIEGEEFLDLVAFRHHLRWAKPCTGTTKTQWRDWRSSFERVIIYQRTRWQRYIKLEKFGADLMGYYSCTTCEKREKIPADSWIYNAVEGGEDSKEEGPVSWIEPNFRNGMDDSMCSRIYPTLSLENRTGAVGEIEKEKVEERVHGEVTHYPPPKKVTVNSMGDLVDLDFMSFAASETQSGQQEPNPNYPIRNKEWRLEGDVDVKAQEFAKCAQSYKTYSPEDLSDLMKRGDELVQQMGDIRDAVCHVQEYRLRISENLLSNMKEVTHLPPVLGRKVQELCRIGACPVFWGETPTGERERGLPYGRGQSGEITKKLRKDVAAGRMFICSARTVGSDPKILASPSTLVPKRLPDRTMSNDKRLIADLRSVNNYTKKEDYHAMTVPNIATLAKRVEMLKRRSPGKQLVCTKRDIDSACRRVNLHPDASIIMCTEVLGSEIGLPDDPMFYYLALPFGWNGSPGCFALVTDFMKEVIAGYKSSTPSVGN